MFTPLTFLGNIPVTIRFFNFDWIIVVVYKCGTPSLIKIPRTVAARVVVSPATSGYPIAARTTRRFVCARRVFFFFLNYLYFIRLIVYLFMFFFGYHWGHKGFSLRMHIYNIERLAHTDFYFVRFILLSPSSRSF